MRAPYILHHIIKEIEDNPELTQDEFDSILKMLYDGGFNETEGECEDLLKVFDKSRDAYAVTKKCTSVYENSEGVKITLQYSYNYFDNGKGNGTATYSVEKVVYDLDEMWSQLSGD